MTLHKLTAGDGYTYLTRQVAAHDATQRGYDSLGEYYTEKGESPGLWMGSGCAHLPQFSGGEVSEAQMRALFGEGRHPDAERIEAELIAAGHGAPAVLTATRLGSPFRRFDGANEFRRRVAAEFGIYNVANGARHDAPVPADVRAEIRTRIARELFVRDLGREPADDREFSGFVAKLSRQATTAVAGYDLTFSPAKSISALWAIAPVDVAKRIEQAHNDAVRDTIDWLERNAAYTRRGREGEQQIEVNGLICAAFTHRDSRAGDPDLHTHVAVSNKVQAQVDGRWLALDGRPMHKLTVTASERYNTRLEAMLTERLGVRFGPGPNTTAGGRELCEIVGVDPRLLQRWSSRRASITARKGELAAAFQAEHGRTHTAGEGIALAQQATLETRQAKHEPRSLGEQRTAWWAEAAAALGGDQMLRRMIARTVGRRTATQRRLSDTWIREAAEAVLLRVQQGRATWQECHVRAEAERYVRGAVLVVEVLDEAVDRIVATALAPDRSIPLGASDVLDEPALLRRGDGSSVYEQRGTQLYTDASILDAEARLVALATRTGARALTPQAIDLALLEVAANGLDLNPGQAQLVRELARSGLRLQLALAPAGTGKTTAMRALARVWQTPDVDGRQGQVVGLAPSAAAAAVLREEIGSHTDTIAKLLHALDHEQTDRIEWVRGIGPHTLVIIDEAGMAGTADLARATEFITARGGTIRLIGDDQQLASVAAGGALRDIAASAGAVHLSQVMRFTDPAEGAASLALRAGDTAAIGFYLDRGRVHVGDQASVTDAAFDAWSRDRLDGKDTLLVAPTRELVTALNTRARADRIARTTATTEIDLTLGDGSTVSVGDVIITRRNDRALPITGSDFVKNGDRWTVTTASRSGAVTARHHGTGRVIVLPARYVAEHVVLGYATTVHGAQGITADTCHVVATGTETRQLTYVALTRGRTENHLYLATANDGDPHSAVTRDALLPPTAADIFARMIDRDGSQISATTAQEDLLAPATRLRDATARYHDALLTAAEAALGDGGLQRLATVAEQTLPGLTAADAWPTLRSHLALLTLDGLDVPTVLAEAIGRRSMTGSADPAAVLDWRLDPTGRRGISGPLAWLPATPAMLKNDPVWGDYLARRASLVTELADEVGARARAWDATTAPHWAKGLHGRSPELTAELAVWRAALGIFDSEPQPCGPERFLASEARQHRRLTNQIQRVLGDPAATAQRYRAVVDALDPRIAIDPYWPQLAERLATARRAGLDPDALVRTAGADGPLPDEHPAAAVWWRICRHLSPATLTGDAATVTTLRPRWTDELATILGQDNATKVVADPAWPALVAAVTDASVEGWQPQQLLQTAYELLHSGHPSDEPLRPDELATALVWRVSMLTDPANTGSTTTTETPGEASVASQKPPEPDTLIDADWARSLLELEPPADEVHPEPDHSDRAADVVTSTELTSVAALDRTDVRRARIVELNRQAHEYFQAQLPAAWAESYLTDRLGRDLVGRALDRYEPGYAPGGWTHLVNHLRLLGATDTELTDAGLVTTTRTGRLIDRFRDRLILPIWHLEEIHGFVARRNPQLGEEEGPKYLNTPETPLFHKGDQLYGMHETRDLLAHGATPVLVEGPLDALAVTLAGGGKHVGVAPLGTAFTNEQADLLRPYLGPGKPGVIVATDNDPAGQHAAERAYWQLTARGADPGRLAQPEGLDPADMLLRHGSIALTDALQASPSLAAHLIDRTIDRFAGRLDTAEATVHAIRAAAQIAGAAPPTTWLSLSEHIEQRVQTKVDNLVLHEILEAGTAWTDAPFKHAAERARARHPVVELPEQKWAELGRSIRPDLITGRDWIPLAQAIHEAANAGHEIETELRDATREPLPYRDPARELHQRLVARGVAAASQPSTEPGHASQPAGTDTAEERPMPANSQREPVARPQHPPRAAR